MERLEWPPVALGRRLIHSESAWRALLDGCPPLSGQERRAMMGKLGRRLLCQTVVGRQRLRQWLAAQRGRPIPIETRADRRERITATLSYYGDDQLLPLFAGIVAALPRPVTDHVIEACMIITVGCTSAAWTCGAFPPGRLPVVISGHRSGEEIARSARHEIAHRWLIDHSSETAPTPGEYAHTLDKLRVRYPDTVVRAFVREGEREADRLAFAWEASCW